jgi:hypothetical protein
MFDFRPIAGKNCTSEFHEFVRARGRLRNAKTEFIAEIEGGGVKAGVFEILNNCGEKFVADARIIWRKSRLEIETMGMHFTLK